MSKIDKDQDESARIYAIASLILSCLAVIGSVFAGICVLPIMLISAVLAVLGLKSSTAKILSIIALSIDAVGLLLGIMTTFCAASAILPFLFLGATS
ncbi:MAG: hypothetical protein PHS44_06935 [Candidatus Dojkabacteria bacterium]|nr:hypothetical protein [Candidatus Dojkabacteria bacterium]